ncbi:MCE family protein [Candidatus Fermentibacteria bacterium]|nr:MCE family protein [Candidatus Fermentibacteria bacterium]
MRETPFVKVVGLFVLGAGIMAVAAIVGLGVRQGWLIPRATLWTMLDSAEHLRVGDPVTLAGLTVGEIDRFVLTDKLRIAAALKVERRSLAHLKRGTCARAEPPLLIGAGRIVLIPSGSGERVADGDTIPAVTGGGLARLTASAQPILDRADSIAALLHTIAAEMVPLTATLAHPDSAFRRILRSTASLLDMTAAPEGLLTSLAADGPLRIHVDSTLIAAQTAAEELAELLCRLNAMAATSDTLLRSLAQAANSAAETTPELVPLLQELRLTLEQTRASWILGGRAEQPLGAPGLGRMNP